MELFDVVSSCLDTLKSCSQKKDEIKNNILNTDAEH